MAAVLASGRNAVLSHRAAAALWGLRPPTGARIDVTLPRRVRPGTGITLHRRSLPADEVTVLRAIPVTTVPRTLLDLATVLDKRQVERTTEEAERRRLDDPLSLRDLLTRYPGRRGTATIRAILETASLGTTITRSELEERFLAFLRARSLPSPEQDQRVLGDRRQQRVAGPDRRLRRRLVISRPATSSRRRGAGSPARGWRPRL